MIRLEFKDKDVTLHRKKCVVWPHSGKLSIHFCVPTAMACQNYICMRCGLTCLWLTNWIVGLENGKQKQQKTNCGSPATQYSKICKPYPNE
jgi:hypothetical protein